MGTYVKLFFEEEQNTPGGVTTKDQVDATKVVANYMGENPAEMAKATSEVMEAIERDCGNAIMNSKYVGKFLNKLAGLLKLDKSPEFLKTILKKIGAFLNKICTPIKNLVMKNKVSKAAAGAFVMLIVGLAAVAVKFKLNLKDILKPEFWKQVWNKVKEDKSFKIALAIVAALAIISFGVIYYIAGKKEAYIKNAKAVYQASKPEIKALPAGDETPKALPEGEPQQGDTQNQGEIPEIDMSEIFKNYITMVLGKDIYNHFLGIMLYQPVKSNIDEFSKAIKKSIEEPLKGEKLEKIEKYANKIAQGIVNYLKVNLKDTVITDTQFLSMKISNLINKVIYHDKVLQAIRENGEAYVVIDFSKLPGSDINTVYKIKVKYDPQTNNISFDLSTYKNTMLTSLERYLMQVVKKEIINNEKFGIFGSGAGKVLDDVKKYIEFFVKKNKLPEDVIDAVYNTYLDFVKNKVESIKESKIIKIVRKLLNEAFDLLELELI